MNRGEIWLVNFDPTIGSEIKKTRPAIIVSDQPFNRLRRTLVVVPLSGTPTQTDFPLLVAIGSALQPCVAVVDQVRAAAKERFVRKLAVATPDEMTQIGEALATIMNLD